MSDEINSKVIDIFQRHRRGDQFHFEVEEGGELVISPDGFHYVSFKQDRNGNDHDETALTEVATMKHYIIKILEVHREHHRLNNYYIPGNRLQEFLTSLSSRPGQILEIQQFIPDHIG